MHGYGMTTCQNNNNRVKERAIHSWIWSHAMCKTIATEVGVNSWTSSTCIHMYMTNTIQTTNRQDEDHGKTMNMIERDAYLSDLKLGSWESRQTIFRTTYICKVRTGSKTMQGMNKHGIYEQSELGPLESGQTHFRITYIHKPRTWNTMRQAHNQIWYTYEWSELGPRESV